MVIKFYITGKGTSIFSLVGNDTYLKTFLSKFLRLSSRLSWQIVASYVANKPSFPLTFLFFPLLCLRCRKTLEYLEDNWLKLTKICNDKRLYLVTKQFSFLNKILLFHRVGRRPVMVYLVLGVYRIQWEHVTCRWLLSVFFYTEVHSKIL